MKTPDLQRLVSDEVHSVRTGSSGEAKKYATGRSDEAPFSGQLLQRLVARVEGYKKGFPGSFEAVQAPRSLEHKSQENSHQSITCARLDPSRERYWLRPTMC
jgi:hypothetical protein